jgi:beta-lactamase family protein
MHPVSMQRPAIVALVVALLLAPAAAAGDAELLRAKERYLGPAQLRYGTDPNGLQARYDAGRDLVEAVRAAGRFSLPCNRLRGQLLGLGTAQVITAEAADRPVRTRAPGLPRVDATCRAGVARISPASSPPVSAPFRPEDRRAAPPVRPDRALDLRLAEAAARFAGTAGVWVHDLRTGRTGSVNADARFPAASTVKLGVLAATLASHPRPERSPLIYDARQIAQWSSNLGANRIVSRLGLGAVADGFRRLGMTSSTYPGLYRAGTGAGPPGAHRRVTTPRDLGRALFRLHAAALGRPWALRATGLSRKQANTGRTLLLGSQPTGDNAGLFRRWLVEKRLVQKHGWISDSRLSAAIVYRRSGPVIVVVAAYRPGVTVREAQLLGREVLRAAALAE